MSEVPPHNAGPYGLSEMSRSWQTVGSTMGALAVLALAAGAAAASAVKPAARTPRGFRRDIWMSASCTGRQDHRPSRICRVLSSARPVSLSDGAPARAACPLSAGTVDAGRRGRRGFAPGHQVLRLRARLRL